MAINQWSTCRWLSSAYSNIIAFSALIFALCVLFSLNAAAQSIDDDDDATTSAPPPTAPTAFTPATPVTDPDSESVSWGVPPMPWRAQLGLAAYSNRNDSSSSNGFSKDLTANAMSYIWQPWFVSLDSNASFRQSDSSAGFGASYGESYSGGLIARVLPTSRFPATISFGAGSISNTSASQTITADYQNFNWNQGYTPADGGYRGNMNYWWNAVGRDGENTVSNRMRGDLTFVIKSESPQSLRLNSDFVDTKTSNSGPSTRQVSVAGDHSIYLEDYVMSISSNLSTSQSEVLGSPQGSKINQSQAVSSMDWIPSDDYPLRITSGARHFVMDSEANNQSESVSSGLSSTDFNLTARYPLDRNWSFSASTLAQSTKSTSGDSAVSRSSYSLGATAGWQGDGLTSNFDQWLYRASYGSSLGATYQGYRGESAPPPNTVGAWSTTLGNSFSRNFSIDNNANPLGLTLNQSLSVVEQFGQQTVSSSQTLNHSANISWSPDSGPDSQTSISGSVLDGRTFGEIGSYYQSVTGTISGRRNLGRYQSLSGTLSILFSKQGTKDSDNDWQGRATLNLQFSHARFADIDRLYFSMNYNLLASPKNESGYRDENSQWGFEHRLNEALSWRYGLLSWRLENQNALAPNGVFSTSIWLKVTRDFGGVL